MSSANGKDNSGPSRSKYWLKHDKPLRKIVSMPGMQKRIRASDYSLLQIIVDLGERSDSAIRYAKPSDLVRNRAYVEHQQKLNGALGRLARLSIGVTVPHRAELAALKSAFKTLDIHYEPCGKRSKTNRCKLGDGHINDCKDEP